MIEHSSTQSFEHSSSQSYGGHIMKVKWKQDPKLNPHPAGLPRERGSYVVFFADGLMPLPRFPRGYCVHFSWIGKSFRLRNFLAGQSAAQDANTSAADVYAAGRYHQPCVGDLSRSVTDTEFWTAKLAELSEAIYESEGWKLGKAAGT
jgi:hypothetical protein